MKPTLKTRLATAAARRPVGSKRLGYNPLNREEYLARIKQAEALYKVKCEKVAGIKIYKTVPDVEGVLLMKIRPDRTDRELADPNWPGAAFGRGLLHGDSYIRSFLGYEYPAQGPIDALHRGYINTDKRPGGLPGYRWVEIPDPRTASAICCSARYDEPWQTDKTT